MEEIVVMILNVLYQVHWRIDEHRSKKVVVVAAISCIKIRLDGRG